MPSSLALRFAVVLALTTAACGPAFSGLAPVEDDAGGDAGDAPPDPIDDAGSGWVNTQDSSAIPRGMMGSGSVSAGGDAGSGSTMRQDAASSGSASGSGAGSGTSSGATSGTSSDSGASSGSVPEAAPPPALCCLHATQPSVSGGACADTSPKCGTAGVYCNPKGAGWNCWTHPAGTTDDPAVCTGANCCSAFVGECP